MKVKNIAFSGFAAAILGGVCGATDASAITLVSPEYVTEQLKEKQDVLTEATGIKIDETTNVISADTTVVATKAEVEQVKADIPTDTVTSAQLQDVSDSIPTAVSQLTNDSNYVTSSQLQTADYATTGYVDNQIRAVESEIPTTVAELTDAGNYALKSEVQGVANGVSELQGTIGDAALQTTAQTITAAINELKGKTDGMATTGNFAEMNNKITGLEQLVGTESVKSQIQSATSGLASQDDLDTLSGRVDATEGEIDSLQGAVSDLQNAGYATTQYVDDEIDAVEGKIPTTVAELTDADNYALKSELPTRTSQLTNDSGFITGAVADLAYDKIGAAADVQTAVNDAKYISGLNQPAGNYIVSLDGNGNVSWKSVVVVGKDGEDLLNQ